MQIKLKRNKRAENLKSMLYCAIHFGDFDCVESILHPNGIFLGMNKHRFIYFLRKEYLKDQSEYIADDSQIWSVMIEVGKYAGERCFIFNRDHMDKNNRPIAYVFIVHPHQQKSVWKIIHTTNYINEKTLTKRSLMFNKDKGKKFNSLYKN
tara:strand:- start:1395 stop:1847 length:453 start_codon:yes stop_codon:yes gene_type:complete